MKFVVRNVKNGCRLGHLTEMTRCPDVTMDTPNCMLYTRTGSAPNLTKDMLQRIDGVPQMALMSASNFIRHKEAITSLGGVAKFTNMQDHLVYSCPNDPVAAIPSGYNDRHTIGLWARGGKVKVDPRQYMSLQESLVPDMYEAMADCDIPEDATNKKLLKSCRISLDWLDECLQIQAESKKLKGSSMLGVLTGGYSVTERVKFAKELAVRPLAGYVIDGFYSSGEIDDGINMTAIRDVISPAMAELPVEKPRFMKGSMRPDQIMEAVEMGVDIFGSSYCYQVTERGSALTFDFDYHSYKEHENSPSGIAFEISLKDKRYFDDLSPLLIGCECYTCRTHTRSYVTHLLNTSEMLASVLLIIHNFHHYFRFFKAIRQSLTDAKFTSLKSMIIDQRKTEENGR